MDVLLSWQPWLLLVFLLGRGRSHVQPAKLISLYDAYVGVQRLVDEMNRLIFILPSKLGLIELIGFRLYILLMMMMMMI